MGSLLKDRYRPRNPLRRKGPHVFTYSAICDVPQETLLYVTALLPRTDARWAPGPGDARAPCRTQAKLVLR